MGLYKELAHAIAKLESQQQRIFSDAADFGVPVKKDTAAYKAFQAIISEAKQSFVVKREEHRYSTGLTVRTEFMIPWEQDGDFVGTKYILEYVGSNSRKITNYVSIESKPHTQKESPFRY